MTEDAKKADKFGIFFMRDDLLFIACDRSTFRRRPMAMNFDRVSEFSDFLEPFERTSESFIKLYDGTNDDRIFIYEPNKVTRMIQDGRLRTLTPDYNIQEFDDTDETRRGFLNKFREQTEKAFHIYTLEDRTVLIFTLSTKELRVEHYPKMGGLLNDTKYLDIDYEMKILHFDGDDTLYIIDIHHMIYVYRRKKDEIIFDFYTKIELRHYLQCDLSIAEGGNLRGIIRTKKNKTITIVQSYYYENETVIDNIDGNSTKFDAPKASP